MKNFLNNIKKGFFPFLIATSALSVSASAAFYSVSGLSKLFAGASIAVIIMAASLEAAKLIIASLLYQYRKALPKLLKWYLALACFVLILITSMGIYGFLSAAYQETANKAGNIDAQIALVETKRNNVRDQLEVYNAEKSTINGAVANLQSGLANNVIQYKDSETGQIITTTSSSTRKALERQLDQAIIRQTEINTKIDNLNTQLFDYETEIVDIQTNSELAGELGPLKYLSGLTGVPMDKIINWLLLIIIFVFDPLAISLVIAANFAFEKAFPKKDDDLSPNPQVKPKNPDVKHNEWDSTLQDGLKEEDEPEWDWEAAEKRMDIIGQNGNDGEHYDKEVKELKDLKSSKEFIDQLDKHFPIKDFDEDHALDEVLNDMVKDIEVIDEQEVNSPQEEEKKGFNGGNFRVRPKNDEDYNSKTY